MKRTEVLHEYDKGEWSTIFQVYHQPWRDALWGVFFEYVLWPGWNHLIPQFIKRRDRRPKNSILPREAWLPWDAEMDCLLYEITHKNATTIIDTPIPYDHYLLVRGRKWKKIDERQPNNAMAKEATPQ